MQCYRCKFLGALEFLLKKLVNTKHLVVEPATDIPSPDQDCIIDAIEDMFQI